MNLPDIAKYRLLSQHIAGIQFNSAKELVHWMGAMQSQDYAMAKWAIGIRLPGSTDKSIEESLNKGEILRTHVLRPTWHFVSPEDISWMLDLTAPRIKSSIQSRQKQLELTRAVLQKSNNVLEKALTKAKYVTRETLVNELNNASIPTDINRASHLLLWAELEGLICSGTKTGNNQTYTLLENCIPKKNVLSREEAIGTLARRYLFSHGPATLHDFSWWSGLSVTDARQGFELNKPVLISETVRSKTYWFSNSLSIHGKNDGTAFLLPAYDEFIISYRDRMAAIDAANQKKLISDNGIFRPVIIINGQVTGLWKRTINKDIAVIETSLIRPHNKRELGSIEKAGGKFGDYLDRKIVIRNN